MSCRASIELETRDFYTGGDQVCGTVRIDQKKDINLTEIIVQFIGELYCIIFDGSTTVDRTERIHEQTVRLFPNEELSELMSQYTLKEGAYEYPFQFTVPGHLPGEVLYPSYENSSSNIRYYVKATVRRSSNWKLNTRSECQVTTRPCTDASLLNDPVRVETFEYITMVRKRHLIKRWSSANTPVLNAHIGVRRAGLCAAAVSPELELVLTKNEFLVDELKLVNVAVLLYRKDRYSPSRYSSDSRNFKYPILNNAMDHTIQFRDNRADISHVLETVRVPGGTLPSLSTGYIEVHYRLHIVLSLESGKAHRKLTLKPNVGVLSELIHDHTAPPEEHEPLPAYDNSHTKTTASTPACKYLPEKSKPLNP